MPPKELAAFLSQSPAFRGFYLVKEMALPIGRRLRAARRGRDVPA
jgi:hypothetical protein